MELTASFVDLLQHFAPVFTTPTYQTFVVIVTGWILSQRHRYVTEVIFSGGNVGDGHWSRFHRFFSHAAWDIDTFSVPGQVGRHHSGPRFDFVLGRRRHPLSQTRADPLRRRHALRSADLQSRQVPGQLGTRLGRALPDHRPPFWAPTKVFALPIAMRLYRNRQGLTKGKKGRGKAAKPKHDPNHRTRPELALELIHGGPVVPRR